jgi:hypothetical protein
MTKMRPVPFAEFRRFLERFGFMQRSNPDYCVFDHPEEGVLAYRSYRDDEPVLPRDLLRTRKIFDLRGIMEADDFDAQLLRAHTPA